MKNKIYLLIFIIILAITAGCNKPEAGNNDNNSAFKVGIAVINNHPALLEIEKGITENTKIIENNNIFGEKNEKSYYYVFSSFNGCLNCRL